MFRKRLLPIFLSLLVLVSGSGVILAIHTCLESSQKDVSLFSHDGCCGEMDSTCALPCDDESNFELKCCTSEVSYHKVDLNTQLGNPQPDLPLPVLQEINFLVAVPADPVHVLLPREYSPPSEGNHFIYSIHQLLI